MFTKEYYRFCHWSFLYSDLKLVMAGNKGIYQKWCPPTHPNPNTHLEPEQLWGLNPSSQQIWVSFTASTLQINAILAK